MDYRKIELCTLADGAAVEAFDRAFNEVLANIDDPNTTADTTREITVKIKITPNEQRDQATIEIQAHSKLAPKKAEKAVAFMRNDGKKLVAFEHNFRQPDLGFDKTKVTSIDNKSRAGGEREE